MKTEPQPYTSFETWISGQAGEAFGRQFNTDAQRGREGSSAMTETRCDDCNDILPLTPDEIAEIREDYPCAILCDECRSRRRDCCGERPEDCRCDQPVLTPSLRGAAC